MNRNRARRTGAAAAIVVAATVFTGCAASDEAVTSTGGPGPADDGSGGSGGSQRTDGTTTNRGASSDQTQPATNAADPSVTAPPARPPASDDDAVSSNGPPTTHPDPNEPPPPVTETPTIPANGQDPAMIDCGTLYRAAGWPTTFVMNPESFSCLAEAFTAGTPARLVDREQTDGFGGAILVTTYDVLGPGNLRQTVDATQAADRPKIVTVSMCTGVVAGFSGLTLSGCVEVGR